MNPLNKIKNLFEKLKEYVSHEEPTKKEILVLCAVAPLAIFLGVFLGRYYTEKHPRFEKYNTETLSLVDSLSIDTLINKKGEIYADTLIDYYTSSKKEIKFRTFNDPNPEGFLLVKNKKFSKYKLLENGIPSKEILEQNNEVKIYSISKNFLGRVKLNKLELMKYWTSDFLKDSFKINQPTPINTRHEVYTRENDLGKRVLTNEQAKVRRYLNEIVEYKKSLKD